MTSQRVYHLISLLCFSSLLAALFFQYYDNLEPCILCVMQRFFFLLIGMVALVAGLHTSSSRLFKHIYNILLALLCLVGASLATRQLWLQHLPASKRPLCAPSLEFIFSTFEPSEIAAFLFTGTGDCGEVTWQLLGLSMAAWSLLIFCGVFLLVVYAIVRQK